MSAPPREVALGPLEAALRAGRAAGRKLLVGYVTGGLGPDWLEAVRALAAGGADAIEVGIPFSDPVMDGPVIQEASRRALEAGARPQAIISALSGADVGVPLIVMTYVNIVAHEGYKRMASRLSDAGVAGVILPDLCLEEADEWLAEADAASLETVQLVAPTTSDERLAQICEQSRGFVYAVGLLGVTGERSEVASSALAIARRSVAVTDKPVLVGIGVSTPEQAREICVIADGVVVGSAIVRRLLDGEGPDAVAHFVGSLRRGLDETAGGPAGSGPKTTGPKTRSDR